MECLANTVGLRGGCEDISTTADLYLDTKVTYRELSAFVDQNDHVSVSDLFSQLRTQASKEVVDEVNAHMRGSYVSKTVIENQKVGDTNTTLTSSPAVAKLKGIRFEQYNSDKSLMFRITRIGFIGAYTGNVTVTYYDGITGQSLATDTIAAVSGQLVETYVNRVFRREVLTVVYDATAINGYQTYPNYLRACYTCPPNRLNGFCFGIPVTTPVGSPLSYTSTNEMGGLQISINMECDHESWLCDLKQHLGMPMLYKVAELAMEYALHTGRANTNVVRDYDRLKDRQSMYHEHYQSSMKRALSALTLPNDPICFVCRRTNRIGVQIP